MTNQQILEKAIHKAINSGWEPSGRLAMWVYKTDFVEEEQYGYIYEMVGLNDLIFNHQFCKALWSDKFHMTNSEYGEGLDEWEYHLQQMVIANDPIAYLGENL